MVGSKTACSMVSERISTELLRKNIKVSGKRMQDVVGVFIITAMDQNMMEIGKIICEMGKEFIMLLERGCINHMLKKEYRDLQLKKISKTKNSMVKAN